ncbi:Uncharacterised protein [Afipia felis]|uniref:Uncharacterized protein n=3 Tax=Afipia felis TaxID=1035 RepID=A0A381B093_AFIFE|nr:hypothetical protein [Afipia felis]EKS26700.1 hypothetical protein HMPREF9697_04003 [Afipia felis ATCC 53690]SUU76151.1 Uncharacterised protein [Afipia felis]SUU84218.1 Uncharacterised protein [Afipia felis]SUW28217.1 Uncharacterised protein [Afipia felis]
MMRAMRWGDNDRYFGPFTWHPGDWKKWTVLLSSSGDGEGSPCHLRISAWKYTLILALPNVIQPFKERIVPGWDAATVERLGRDFYWSYDVRSYGFTLSDGHLVVHFGRNGGRMMDSRLRQQWSCFLPWTQWRQIAHRIYNADGTLEGEVAKMKWDDRCVVIDRATKARFLIEDYDGETIEATTYAEEREWRLGTGWFRWIGFLLPKKRRRALNLEFAREVGPEKGSWKGGLIGTGFEMRDDETHEHAFRRYCSEDHRSKSGLYRVKFLGSRIFAT